MSRCRCAHCGVQAAAWGRVDQLTEALSNGANPDTVNVRKSLQQRTTKQELLTRRFRPAVGGPLSTSPLITIALLVSRRLCSGSAVSTSPLRKPFLYVSCLLLWLCTAHLTLTGVGGKSKQARVLNVLCVSCVALVLSSKHVFLSCALGASLRPKTLCHVVLRSPGCTQNTRLSAALAHLCM